MQVFDGLFDGFVMNYNLGDNQEGHEVSKRIKI